MYASVRCQSPLLDFQSSQPIADDSIQQPPLARSSHLEEYSQKRPASAGGVRPRALLNKVAQAAGLAAEDSDAEGDESWVLEGWGEEPSVPEKARQASTKLLSKWARNLPCSLPTTSQRRVASAGPHKHRTRPGADTKRQGNEPSSPTKQGPGRRVPQPPVTRRLARPQHADLEVGDESDVEEGATHVPSRAHQAAKAAATATHTQPSPAPGARPVAAGATNGPSKPVGQQTQQLMHMLSSPQASHLATKRSADTDSNIPATSSSTPEPTSTRTSDTATSRQAISGPNSERASHCGQQSQASASTATTVVTAPVLSGDQGGMGGLCVVPSTMVIKRSPPKVVSGPLDPLEGVFATQGRGLAVASGVSRATALAVGVPESARAAAAAAAAAKTASETAVTAAAVQASLTAARTAAKAKLAADLEVLLQKRSVLQRQPASLGSGGAAGEPLVFMPLAADSAAATALTSDLSSTAAAAARAGSSQGGSDSRQPQPPPGRRTAAQSGPPRAQVPKSVQQLDLKLPNPFSNVPGWGPGDGDTGLTTRSAVCSSSSAAQRPNTREATSQAAITGLTASHSHNHSYSLSTGQHIGSHMTTGNGPGPPRVTAAAVGASRGPPPHMLRGPTQMPPGFDVPPARPFPSVALKASTAGVLRHRASTQPILAAMPQEIAALVSPTGEGFVKAGFGGPGTQSQYGAGPGAMPGLFRRTNSDVSQLQRRGSGGQMLTNGGA